MDNESRKAEIRRRLLIAQHPRRQSAEFTTENDHNPLVLQDCRRCHGSGDACVHGKGVEEITECPDCDGEGITGKLERFFSNDELPQTAKPNSFGWVHCPNCGWRFHLSDVHSWTGLRHKKCGQKLIVAPCDS